MPTGNQRVFQRAVADGGRGMREGLFFSGFCFCFCPGFGSGSGFGLGFGFGFGSGFGLGFRGFGAGFGGFFLAGGYASSGGFLGEGVDNTDEVSAHFGLFDGVVSTHEGEKFALWVIFLV